jgi:hypothetical protein
VTSAIHSIETIDGDTSARLLGGFCGSPIGIGVNTRNRTPRSDTLSGRSAMRDADRTNASVS